MSALGSSGPSLGEGTVPAGAFTAGAASEVVRGCKNEQTAYRVHVAVLATRNGFPMPLHRKLRSGLAIFKAGCHLGWIALFIHRSNVSAACNLQ